MVEEVEDDNDFNLLAVALPTFSDEDVEGDTVETASVEVTSACSGYPASTNVETETDLLEPEEEYEEISEDEDEDDVYDEDEDEDENENEEEDEDEWVNHEEFVPEVVQERINSYPQLDEEEVDPVKASLD